MLATPEVNGINHKTHIQAAGPPARFGRGNQMVGNEPLAVSQIYQESFYFHKEYVWTSFWGLVSLFMTMGRQVPMCHP